MFASTSRYAALDTRTEAHDGRTVTYVRRRFLPPGRALPTLAEVTVTEGDRLDRIAARTLGDPEAFWLIADANDAMHPASLTAVPGRRLRVPLPQPAL